MHMISNRLFGAALLAGAASLALTTASQAEPHDHGELSPEASAQGVETLLEVQSDEGDKGEAMPTMSFGTWGVDPALLNPSVDPGDDFFAYVNSKWLDANPLPSDFSPY